MGNRIRWILSICLLICIVILPCVAFAFQPAWLTIEVIDAPEELKYIDILVPKDMKEIHLDYLNAYASTTYPVVKEAMTGFESDGFVSYSLYFEVANCVNDIKRKREETKAIFAPGQYQLFDAIKVVTLDKNGSILTTSKTVSLKTDFFHLGGVPIIKYDYANNEASVTFQPYAFSFLSLIIGSLIFFGIPSALASVVIKLLIALLYKVKPDWIFIVLIFATQGVIALATPFLTGFIPFWAGFAAMELLVISVECTILSKKAIAPAKPKLLLYLLTANTITAILNALVFGGLYGFFRI